MADMTSSWNELAKVKRESIAKAIPQEWRIEIIPSSEEQRDVTGHYIHQYLSPKEIEITESDALDIVGKTSIGTWSAEEVTRAFCHRASLAHQLVRIYGGMGHHTLKSDANLGRMPSRNIFRCSYSRRKVA